MRTAHKATAVMIAAALTLTLTGCGGTTPKVGARATASTTPTATATPTPASTTAPPLTKGALPATADNPLGVDWAKQTPFTGPASDKFGAVNVMAAYREAVEFSLQEGYTNLMAKGYEVKPVEFNIVKPFMTPAAQQSWDGKVSAALANPKDTKAAGAVALLTTWHITGDGKTYKFREGQQLYTLGRDFSPATTSVNTLNGVDRLVLHFTVSRDLRVMKDDKALLYPMKKDITYWMVPNGLPDYPWLIDAWTISTTEPTKISPDPIGATA